MTTDRALTSWDRLIRYVPVDDPKAIRFGEPIVDSADDDVASLADQGKLTAKVLRGDSFVNATATDQIEKVGKLLGPLTPGDVPIIRCVGLNYKTHILETGRSLPACPTMFTKPGPSVADYGEDIPIPKIAQEQVDYEGELVVVIGKDVKNISEEDALDAVAGFVVGNDVSARDWQRESNKAGPVPQWSFSKSFDKYAPLGPAIVSPRVVGDASSLSLTTYVNGEVRQQSDTSDLVFGVKKLVSHLSQGQTLQKGSLIMTGTPGGVGLFMKPPIFLKSGDVVEVEIGKLGKLRNTMIYE